MYNNVSSLLAESYYLIHFFHYRKKFKYAIMTPFCLSHVFEIDIYSFIYLFIFGFLCFKTTSDLDEKSVE